MQHYGKDTSSLNVDQTLGELEHMLDFFKDCHKIGQGISSKEYVYYRNLKVRLAVLDIDRANQFLDEEERVLER